jgi:hypothetical protein
MQRKSAAARKRRIRDEEVGPDHADAGPRVSGARRASEQRHGLATPSGDTGEPTQPPHLPPPPGNAPKDLRRGTATLAAVAKASNSAFQFAAFAALALLGLPILIFMALSAASMESEEWRERER